MICWFICVAVASCAKG